MPVTEKIRCVVIRLYPKSSEKWSAGVIRLQDGTEAKFVAEFGLVQGEQAHIEGHWTVHPKFGKQFKATEIVWEGTVGSEGIVMWLAEVVPGVGKVRAESAGNEFGESLEAVLITEVERLAEFLSISVETLADCREDFINRRDHVAMIGQLINMGISSKIAARIVGQLGANGVRMIQDNPYSLIGRIDRFGWKTVDQEVAYKLGIGKGDVRRLRAAVKYCFEEAAESDGHTCLTKTDFASRMDRILDLDRSVWIEPIQAMNAEEKEIVSVGDKGVAYHTIHNIEKTVARLLLANQISPRSGSLDNGTLEGKQLEARNVAVDNRFCVITGGAGCGKTFVIKEIAKQMASVVLCAPTGKAAKRLEEVTGIEAKTIHKTLGLVPGQMPLHHSNNTINCEAVIVDEISMCDISLMRQLLSAISPVTKLIMVGDPFQLPSVGAGSVLRDMAASGVIPHVHLDKCHRQAGLLKENCYAILTGDSGQIKVAPGSENGVLSPWVEALGMGSAEAVLKGLASIYSERLQAYKLNRVADVQLITPTNKGLLGTKRLNIWIQSIIQGTRDYWEIGTKEEESNTKYKYFTGDKVIWLQNDYGRGIMNGEMGVVQEIVNENECNVLWNDGVVRLVPTGSADLMALAYAITAHKFQGSQVPVAIVIASSVHSSWGLKNIVNRSWGYTAATRSQKTTILIGDRKGWESMLSREQTDMRQTYLSELLNGAVNDQ